MLKLEDTLPSLAYPDPRSFFCSHSHSHPPALRFLAPWLWPQRVLPNSPSQSLFARVPAIRYFNRFFSQFQRSKISQFPFTFYISPLFDYVSRQISVNMVKSQSTYKLVLAGFSFLRVWPFCIDLF